MKKSSGLFTFLTGVALGAAALFLSKKENRTAAQKEVDQVKAEAQKVVKKAAKVATKVASKKATKVLKTAKRVQGVAKKKAAKVAKVVKEVKKIV